MKKHYTYEDLPKKGENLPELQYNLNDEIILSYLNKIVKNGLLLESIDYEEKASSDEPTRVHITFTLLKEYPKKSPEVNQDASN